MLLVRIGNEEQKWEKKKKKMKKRMKKKKKLEGRRERISEDLSWKEKRVRWKLGEIAAVEEAKKSLGERRENKDRGSMVEVE